MDTTSNNAQQSRDDKKPEKQDFIAHEMEVTKQAMKSAAADIWQQVPTTDDVAAWTKANPLLAVGIAAGAGVVAGFMVTPSRAPKHGHYDGHRGGGGGGILGSIVGAVMPAFSMAVSEAGRSALAAAVAHFTAQQTAENENAEAREEVQAAYADGAASTEAA
jgi:ElaB/YqjD/DUF883 family membrane-anchored ribosome-binding protein